MRRLLLGAYVFMAAWLLVAGGRRIAIELDHGTLDWSPIVSSAIGVLALLLAVPVLDDLIPHHGDRRPGGDP